MVGTYRSSALIIQSTSKASVLIYLHMQSINDAALSSSCSRGTTCSFIHCFHNPGGDYEWADLDKPPPRYWLLKMAALFGYGDESVYDRRLERKKSERMLNSYKMLAVDSDRKMPVIEFE
ncbi:hypothetical protein AABB24_028132 [Solanum stoloniferum]|uniref:C3H1-type domain-containing protein n=1 Tax=Solanum stoloniferum TaxID=62892 RepID=A0ABD2S7P5_9SOLN